MAHIITIGNEKGGVGKTTTVVNLAAAFTAIGKKVLVVDMDPQGNSTELLGVNRGTVKDKSLANLILSKEGFDEYRLETVLSGTHLLAGTPGLRKIVTEFGTTIRQDKLLNRAFNTPALDGYDVVLIDTHGTIDCLLISSLAVSDYYLVPVFAETESARGLMDFLSCANEIRVEINPSLSLLGVVITRHDKKNATQNEFVTTIREIGKQAKVRVFETVIPQSNSVAAASKRQVPVVEFRRDLPVSHSYMALAGEISPSLGKKKSGRPSPPELKTLSNYIEEIETIFT
jgi:chromosome partitioning protein